MTHTDFDEANWIRRLGDALEAVAANARPSYSPLPPETMRSGPIDEYWSALHRGYRDLAARAKHDPAAARQFKDSPLWVKKDPAAARAILREHPLIKSGLVGSGKDEAVGFRILNRAFRSDLTWLVSCLAKLSMKEGGEAAARRLHCYLTAAANASVPAHEITVFHGLVVAGRFDLGRGAYLAPYEHARVEFDLPDEPEPLPETSTPNAGVLVRSLGYGPGVAPLDDYCGSGLPNVQVGYRFPTDYRIDLERWFEDAKFLVDVFSIAVQAPLLSRTRYVQLPKWIQEIDPNFAHWNLDSGGSVSVARPKARELSKSDAEAFVALARDWYTEPEKPHALALAMRRLAASLSRPGGRFGEEDRILDVAIALEICYGGTTGHELAKRAARLLGTDATEQIRTYDEARRFYSVRSRIVHTAEPVPARDSLYRELEAGRDLACRSLKGLLKYDMPVDWTQVRPHLEQEAEDYVERARPKPARRNTGGG